MKQKQKKAAKAALGCLVLLLLYGCASFAPYSFRGEADTADFASKEAAADEISWSKDVSEDLSGETAGTSAESSDYMADENNAKISDTEPEMLAVYVCGAVERPGVYELAAGSRVYEAIAMAGGMTDEAAERGINQAEKLVDGQMVVVLTGEEAESLAQETETYAKEDGRVNINTADAGELKTLSGIGDAKAAAIIAYREKNGAFSSIADIKKVEGIGDGVFAKLENFIKVE